MQRIVITLLLTLSFIAPVFADSTCTTELNQSYRQHIVGQWEFDEQFEIGVQVYKGVANYNANGQFTAKVVNVNNARDILETIKGKWSINNCIIQQTITSSHFFPVGATSRDEIVLLNAEQIQLHDLDEGDYESWHRVS